jgi:hypothetical protein
MRTKWTKAPQPGDPPPDMLVCERVAYASAYASKRAKCDPKWRNAPEDIKQAEAAIVGLQCPMCYSPLLLPINRPPIPVWKVHCNHCATEIPIVVLLNRVAWMV